MVEDLARSHRSLASEPALRDQHLRRARFPIALYWGPELVLLYNDAWSPIPGNKHPWALGRPAREVWPEIWDTIGPLFEQVLTTGDGTYSENQLLPMHRHGFIEECYFNFTFSPVRDQDGRVEGVFNAVLETTHQVQDERQLRTLRDLAAKSNAAKSAEEACAAAAKILGADDADAPFVLLYLTDEAGEHLTCSFGFTEGMPPVGGAPSCWPFEEAARTGAPVVVDDLVARVGTLPGGRWGEPPERAICVPLERTGLPKPYGFLVSGVSPRRALDERYRGFFRLVGDQIATTIANARAYEEERKRADELAALDRAKTAFFSNVSHEFRTPLTLMIGPTEDALAAGRPLAGDELRAVHRNELRLLKLVNALLEFSRMEAGRVQASFEPTDLASFTSDLASTFRSAIERAGLRFRVSCAPLDEPTYVDRALWEKLVLNLLSNALKFTLAGEIAVELRAVDGGVELAVRDTGTGIPAAELPRMFERFHRIEGQKGRTHEGSGIGLALVNEIAKLHGASVSVESTVGAGSTFVVRLARGTAHLPQDRIRTKSTPSSAPLRADAYVEEAVRWLPESDAMATTPARGAPSPAETPGAARIILADDNADMRDYVGRLLRQQWRVEAVGNGAAALEAARREKPDLILSDVMMPVLDGFGLLREVRRDDDLRAVPLILLSARAGEESRVEGLEAGADDYLPKPFSARELLARVRTHLEIARLRRLAELQYQKLVDLFEQAPAVICVFSGKEHVYRFANAPYLHAVGDREIVGKPVREALPEVGDAVYALLDEAFDSGEPVVRSQVFTKLERNGRLEDTYWNLVYQPYRDADGAVEGVMAFGFEVTAEVQARQRAEALARQVQASQSAVEAASRAKDEFLAVLGHELRNPLAPILTALHILRLRGGDAIEKERTVIERQAHHLVRLVDDLLDVSRITRGKVQLKKQRVEVAEVVAKAIEMASPLLEQRQHDLALDVASKGLVIDADPARMAQVISNLLNNAAKYTEPGGRITIVASRAGSEVAIAVRDTGIGITPETLPRVFEMFVQERQALDRSQGGLGLGLTIVRSLVEIHGGTVEARSEGRNRGTEFVVRLPAAAASEGTASESAAPDSPAAHVERDGIRVLIVDDNVDAAEMMAASLELFGHTTRVAHDGPAALKIVEQFAPDIALLDIGLPVMDGYEVARRLRESPRFMRLVAVTGYGQSTDRQRSEAAGFDAHLVKPVSVDELEAVIRQLTADKAIA